MFSFLEEVDLCEMWPNVHRVANIQRVHEEIWL